MLLCLLVCALLASHQALMFSGRCATAMGPLHQRVVSAPGAAGIVLIEATAAAHDAPTHESPVMLGDCPAQKVVMPALAALVLLIISRVLGHAPWSRKPIPDWWWDRLSHPPPLAPSQRRALLQVFLI